VPGEYLSRAALPPPSVKRGRVKRCRRRASLRLIGDNGLIGVERDLTTPNL